jgi:hypothetical protein
LTCHICKKRTTQKKSHGWYKIDAETFMIHTEHREDEDVLWSQMIDRDRYYCSDECLCDEIKILTSLPY